MASPDTRAALIVVDVQRDFCADRALAVPDGDAVVPVLAKWIAQFRSQNLAVVYTRDWHPPNPLSFQEQGGLWPAHCVADERGAQFHPDLPVPKDAWIVSKATDVESNAYSGFDGTELETELRARRIGQLYVGGLATDYCVKATVLDAVGAGFETSVILDAVRAVNVQRGDGAKAIEEMRAAGTNFLGSRPLEGRQSPRP